MMEETDIQQDGESDGDPAGQNDAHLKDAEFTDGADFDDAEIPDESRDEPHQSVGQMPVPEFPEAESRNAVPDDIAGKADDESRRRIHKNPHDHRQSDLGTNGDERRRRQENDIGKAVEDPIDQAPTASDQKNSSDISNHGINLCTIRLISRLMMWSG